MVEPFEQAFFGLQNGTDFFVENTWDGTGNSTSNNASQASTEACVALKSNMNALVLGTLCITAVIFLALMSALERRSRFKLHLFLGKPGPVVPLNLLDGYEDRFAYSLAFGATTSYCISIIYYDAQSVLGEKIAQIIVKAPDYVSVLFKAIATIVLATGAYPLFVCIGTKYKKFGAIFGLIYCITWLSLFCYKTSRLFRDCYSQVKVLLAFDMLSEFPQYFCLVLLMLYFLQRIVLSFKQTCHLDTILRSNMRKRDHYMFQHVRLLLKKRNDEINSEASSTKNCMAKFIEKIKRRMYKPRAEFKYSTRFLCTIAVCFLCIYMLTVFFLEIAWTFLDETLLTYINSSQFESSFSGFGIDLIEHIRTQLKIWIYCFYLAIIISTIKTWLVFLNMLAWHREHLTRLRQGDRKWLPKSLWKYDSSFSILTTQSMKFAGYQVAYAAWGYTIFVIVFWIFLGLLASLLVYPLFVGTSSPLLSFLYKYWPAIAITLGISIAQWLTAKFCFLIQQGKFFAIDNRKAFNIVSYYLFFFNILLGIFSCLLRIIRSLCVGILFLERVQKSVLPSAFEVMDPGYYAYIGYILIEHFHANPVMRVFAHLLSDSIDDDRVPLSMPGSVDNLLADDGMLEDTQIFIAERTKKFKIARNKWFLAYTLMKNPVLIRLRRNSNIDESKQVVDSETSFMEESPTA